MSRTEGLSDIDEGLVAAAEADLDRLLAIEPSAEFSARVRQRMAAEPSVHGWRWDRVALTLAAVAVVIVVSRLGGPTVREHPGPARTVPHQDSVLGNTPAQPGPAVVPSTPSGVRGARHPRRRAPHPAAATEVVIDPAFAEAIRRLMLSTEVSLQTKSDSRLENAAAALTAAEPLDVPELVVKPAEQSGGQ